jgi:SRSO17 transposase
VCKEAQSLQWFLSESRWNPEEVNERRLELMVADSLSAPSEEGVLVMADQRKFRR